MNQTFINLTNLRSDTNLTLYRENNIEIYSAFFVQTTICIIGAILNIINVIVLSHKQFEATPYLFMTALSLTDTGILLVHLPSGWASYEKSISSERRPVLRFHLNANQEKLGHIN
ncbi:uncharacterized protein DC041_0006271 [Schistosoma bovis]|uniref:G-protein coupled receptors family 1 profile domain-containing protein n=1 Tax=Schistosoma bovis TaxID=6184 RepID=A0A430PX50_SCHBO|nr:uncharacterized protein DC041_0006271 [Schistosoma bovis]